MNNGNGNVIRKHVKDKDFTIIDNNIFKNKELTLKAKGLLCLMLSLQEGWEFSNSGLSKLSKDGIDSVKSGLDELEEHGYLIREYTRVAGRFGNVIFNLYEIPHRSGKTVAENTVAEKPSTDNPHNKELINKEPINKVLSNSIVGKSRFTPPTLNEVTEYCNERNNGIDPEYFIDFYTTKDWKVGKNKMKDWKAAIRTWEHRNGNKRKVQKETKVDKFDNYG